MRSCQVVLIVSSTLWTRWITHTPELKATVYTWNQNPFALLWLSVALLLFTLLFLLKRPSAVIKIFVHPFVCWFILSSAQRHCCWAERQVSPKPVFPLASFRIQQSSSYELSSFGNIQLSWAYTMCKVRRMLPISQGLWIWRATEWAGSGWTLSTVFYMSVVLSTCLFPFLFPFWNACFLSLCRA